MAIFLIVEPDSNTLGNHDLVVTTSMTGFVITSPIRAKVETRSTVARLKPKLSS